MKRVSEGYEHADFQGQLIMRRYFIEIIKPWLLLGVSTIFTLHSILSCVLKCFLFFLSSFSFISTLDDGPFRIHCSAKLVSYFPLSPTMDRRWFILYFFPFLSLSLSAFVFDLYNVFYVQAWLSPQPIGDRVLHHVWHVLCGGAAGHQWPASGCESGSSGRKPHGQSAVTSIWLPEADQKKSQVDVCCKFHFCVLEFNYYSWFVNHRVVLSWFSI